MAFMEGFLSENLWCLNMLGYLPFYPRHLVDHQTLSSISKESVVGWVMGTSTR
jgi:hypothetical protein